jgi:hypothetical protein
MRTILFSILILTAVLILAIQPLFAITNGQLDGNLHPIIGALAVIFPDGSRDWVCS